jgi:L-glyceraldehyde 3-phosphate reductase
MDYRPAADRYEGTTYRRCGRSGLRLPPISLGLWHNFGGVDAFETGRAVVRRAFDRGVTHFDLANNYGPPPGSAEEAMGRILDLDLRPWRDELLISSKAGYLMWPGPYGEWGSRKYLLSSLDQSLRRLRLDYVDVFYSHRPDPETPLEETMAALDQAVRQGKALYAGISNYPADRTAEAASILRRLGTPCLIHQPRYSMFDRWIEGGLTEVLQREGIGCIAFSPLAQGLLTDRYLRGIPEGSRAGKPHGFLRREEVTPKRVEKARRLGEIARERGQSLAQMALRWVLRRPVVTSALIGASSVRQLDENLDSLAAPELGSEELSRIDAVLADAEPD